MSPSERADRLEHLLEDSLWVERLALSLVGDPAVAADLSQEALTAALRSGPVQRERLEPWLAGVVRNLARRWKRDSARRASHAREVAEGRPGALPPTEELIAQAELRRIVAEEAEHLAEPYRTTVFLRYFKGLAPAEIAREQGVPAGTVRSRLTRALDQLRRRMDERSAGDRGAWSAIAIGLAQLPPTAVSAPHTPWAEAPWIHGVLTMKALQIATVAALAGAAALGVWSLAHDAGPAEAALPAPAGSESSALDSRGPVKADDEAPPSEALGARTRIVPTMPMAPHAEPTLPPPAPGRARLSLIAVDAARQGLVGARVRVAEAGEHPQETTRWLDLDVRTGAGGAARFEVDRDANSSMLDVEVSYPGLATASKRTRVSTERETVLGMFVLSTGGRAAGSVRDPDGAPVASAVVFATPPSGDWDDSERTLRLGPDLARLTPHTLSGPAGSFVLDGLEAGFVRLWARADGSLYTMTDALEIPANGTLDGLELVLRPERATDRIEGIVLSPSGEPVEATLAYRWVRGHEATSSSIHSGADGRFSMLLDARVPVTFHVIDGENRWSDFVRERVEPGTPDLVLQFEESSQVLVRVQANGAPVTYFRAAAIPDSDEIDGMSIGSLARVPEADHEGGRAQLLVPQRPFRVRVNSPGHAEEVLGPFNPNAAPRELDFHLTPLPGVRGRVLSGGTPVSGVRVLLRRWVDSDSEYVFSGYRFRLEQSDAAAKVRTDAEGRFTIELERAGRYSARAVADGHAPAELGPLDLDPATGADDLVLEFPEPAAIEGRVLTDPSRSPAGTIVAINDGAARPRTQRVGEDGRFRFELLQPGDWQVLAAEVELESGKTFSSYSSGHGVEPIEWSCTVHAGATTRHDLDLRPGGEARVAGTLLLNGAPAVGWTVSLVNDEDRTPLPGAHPAVTGARGEFALGPVPAARVTLVLVGPARGAGGLTLIEPGLELEPGTNVWQLDLPTASVRGTGAPLALTSEELIEYRWHGAHPGHDLQARAPIAAAEDGAFTLPVVPAGPGEVRRWKPRTEGGGWNEWETLAEFAVERGRTHVADLD